MALRILILCTGNSCRSQMAEGFLKSFDPDPEVYSAGTQPASRVSSLAIVVMKELDIDISHNTPKSVDQFISQPFDYVITVCDNANETCPVFTGSVKHRLHIGFEDPTWTMGSEDEILNAHRRVRDQIKAEFSRLFQEIKTQRIPPKDRTTTSRSPWWKGVCGEWYVVGQVALIALVFVGPRSLFGWPEWQFPQIPVPLAAVVLILGGVVILTGILKLGPNLTPFPYPKNESTLVETGIYRLVRHPIYSGGILMSFAWALSVHSWLTLLYVIILFLFFDVKSRREEVWLNEKFPAYKEYQRRVKKLIPYLY